jgi:hypothetical protein
MASHSPPSPLYFNLVLMCRGTQVRVTTLTWHFCYNSEVELGPTRTLVKIENSDSDSPSYNSGSTRLGSDSDLGNLAGYVIPLLLPIPATTLVNIRKLREYSGGPGSRSTLRRTHTCMYAISPCPLLKGCVPFWHDKLVADNFVALTDGTCWRSASQQIIKHMLCCCDGRSSADAYAFIHLMFGWC